ncbi:MAG: carboxypeptidase-like regulatory domain-containing protein, partial [Phycisphaerales bacterium]|nr:carboxypeptidase-like regulatory domain-containing protein [Phycisphaerales bacterium]
DWGFIFNELTISAEDPNAPVTIVQASYNVTSAVSNGGAWRTNTSFPVPTGDTTPAVSFNTSIEANCSIADVDLNHSNMLAGSSSRDCSSGFGTTHTCTLDPGDALTTSGDIYISCVGIGRAETNVSTSGPLAIELLGVASGVVWDESLVAVSGATVYLINQGSNTLESTVTTNSSGGWTATVPFGIYTIVGVNKNNASMAGNVKPHVNVTAS